MQTTFLCVITGLIWFCYLTQRWKTDTANLLFCNYYETCNRNEASNQKNIHNRTHHKFFRFKFFLFSLKMPHKYINYIQLLSEKADKWRRYCICVSCKERLGYDVALLNRFPNKSERIITHLKRCSNFKQHWINWFKYLNPFV